MKKIAIVGLYSIPNMGDKILCEASSYLVNQIDPHTQVIEVDVNPRRKSFYSGKHRIPYMISNVMNSISKVIFDYENTSKSKFRYRFEYLMWYLKINFNFKRCLKEADAVMFAGGGFLKFRTQGLNYYVEQIIKIAEKKGIPVMMNGVGIEGYDEDDIRCQKLKKAINKDCVKVITTRDDVDTLQQKYIYNPNIKTSRVGDPALWTPECYRVKRSHKPRRIGVNIIRGNVFQDYGNSLSALQIKNFYIKLLKGMDKRGWEWKLFSNGMKGDQVLGRKICKDLGVSANKKLCPAPKTSMELLDLVRSFKVVFGARLHACITSYSLDVPVVGLIWSEKSQIFCDVIGKPNNYFAEDELDVNNVLDAIERNFDEEYDTEIRDNLKELTKKYVKLFVESIPTKEVE